MAVTESAAVELITSVSRVMRTTRTYAHQREQQLGRGGLTLGILVKLGQGPLRPGDLALLLHVTPSAVSRATAVLVDQGWLERTTDPSDARACSLRLTPTGSLELLRLHHEHARTLSTALTGWDDDKARTLTHLLDELGSALAATVDAGRSTPHAAVRRAVPSPSHSSSPSVPDSVVATSTRTHHTTHEKASV